MIATMMRNGPTVQDALMGILDALVAILNAMGVLVKWFGMLIDAGVQERLW